MTADRNGPKPAARRWTRAEVDEMDHDDLVGAFIDEHGYRPDAQRLHDFVNSMLQAEKPASREQVEQLIADSEQAQADVRQVLEELRQQHPDRTDAELLRMFDPVEQIMRQNPGANRDDILEMIRAAGF